MVVLMIVVMAHAVTVRMTRMIIRMNAVMMIT